MKTGRSAFLGAVIAVFLISAGACGKSEEKKPWVRKSAAQLTRPSSKPDR